MSAASATVERRDDVPGQHDDHFLGRRSLQRCLFARFVAAKLAVSREPFQLGARRGAERLVRRKALDQFGRGGKNGRRHTVSRYSWTMLTTAEPSPTAAATRLPDPLRASPAAKMPGTLVSNRNGSRINFHPRGGWPSIMRSRPVRMNPCESRSTSPATISVRGDVPMKMNTASAGSSYSSFVSRL